MTGIPADNICLIRTSALGDTVHALAMVNALRKGYPSAHLTWVLQQTPYEMVKHQPGIDRFIVFDRKGGLKEWASLLSRIRQTRFDLLITPQPSDKAGILTLFARAGIKLGFDRSRARGLMKYAADMHIPAAPLRHVQDQFFEFVEFLGIRDYPVKWDFRFTVEERQEQQEFLEKLGRPAAGFVIASAHPEKDLPPSCCARVIDYAEKSLNLQPLIIAGPGRRERRIADEILSLASCRPVPVIESSIRKTMLSLEACRVVISPDTGPLHMAVALGVPTVGIYGYTNPKRCGPYRFRDLLIDMYNTDEPENAPVTRRTKPGRMSLVKPGDVIEKVERALERYSGAGLSN